MPETHKFLFVPASGIIISSYNKSFAVKGRVKIKISKTKKSLKKEVF